MALIDDLLKLPAETSWVEFKKDNADPNMVGRLISALSNAVRLADKDFAYVIWGIRNTDHVAIGTNFEPLSQMHKGQPLELWLSQRLSPAIAFSFELVDYQGTMLVLLKVPAATNTPVEFDRTAYIRVGSATPRLSDYPERLKALWTKLSSSTWETGLALQFLDSDEVLEQLDYVCYFNLTGQPVPESHLDRILILRVYVQCAKIQWRIK
ncbi:MAG: putative DNA binding domain-containing protein [Gammaproteobacteria bacterium]|nr:putative DNA binding domain-containing protein [Gammaproteobacteria bacterium]